MAPTITADPTTVNVNDTVPTQPQLESAPVATNPFTGDPAPEASGGPGTSPTPTPAASPTNPLASSPDAYNPNAAQPYTAPIANDVTPLHSPAEALGPDPQANGAAGHAGQIAYGIDKALRGYMKGKAVAQINQGIALHRQATGLQQNLDMASQQYYALKKAGTDPNSPQMQAAKNQVDAANQANLDFMKQHVAGEQIDKKTGQLKPQQGSIASRLFQTQDQAAVPLAAYQAAQALGPAVYHQTAAFDTPQYRAYAQTQAQTATAENEAQRSAQQLAAVKGQQEIEYNRLLTKVNRTPEENAQLDALGQGLEKAGTLTSRAQDLMSGQIMADVESGRISQEEGIRRLAMNKSHSAAGLFLKQPQAGTKGFTQQKYAEMIYGPGASPSQLNSAQLSYLDQIDAYNKHMQMVSTNQRLIPVVSNGKTGMLPVTTISTRGVAGAPQPPPGSPFVDDIGPVPTEEAASAVSNPVVAPGASAPAVAAAQAAHSNAMANGATPKQALTVARTAAKRTQSSGSGDPPGFIPTNQPRRQTPDETKAYTEENTMGTALTSAEEAARLPDHSVGDKALGASFARQQVGGRLSNFDINRFNNLGSARVRMEGGIAQAIDGSMTDEQRNMILENMRIKYQAQHTLAEHYRNGVGGVGQKPSGGGGTGGAGGGGKTPSADDLENLYQKSLKQPAGAH